MIHFCYKPTLSFTDKEKLNNLKDLNSTYRVIELSEMIEEKLKEISNVNKNNSISSLGSQLQTSAAIQTEMAPGIHYLCNYLQPSIERFQASV